MDAEIGLPPEIVKPWTTVRLDAAVPVAAAARRRELIWVPDHQDLACRFPTTAIALPYRFAAAAAPIQTPSRLWGSFVLMWPASHPYDLAQDEAEVMELASGKLAALLQETGNGYAPRHTSRPRVVPPPEPQVAEAHAVGAARYVDRLREGCVAIDLAGRITFVNGLAADLLGGDVPGLLGRHLWDVAPWLKDPVFDDRCRAASVSQEATSCVVRCPTGRMLTFELFPDPAGISLRVTPAAGSRPIEQYTREYFGSRGLPRVDVFYNLLHVSAALTRALSVQEIIDLITDHVMPVFKAQGMAMLVAEGGKLRLIGSRGYKHALLDRFDGMTLASPFPAEDVLRTGEPVFMARSELRRLYPHVAFDDEMAAWAFLPLTVSDETMGICVLTFGDSHHFAAEECASLTALAGLIAQALDRALLYDTKDRLAHSLQRSLLPRSLPPVPGLGVAARYVPATPETGIGGDFYDLIRLTDTSAAAVIGDVQGHNMTAAALMGQVRTAIHAHAVAGVSPGEVLKHTNRLLIDVDTDLFTSCLLVYVDLQLRTLCVASAGHPPPLLRPPNVPAETIDVPTGVVLGVDPDACYPILEAPFPPGALLALYTDGLVESPGIDLDEAIGSLAEHMTRASAESLHHLAGTMLSHAPHTERHADDIALLLLEHRPDRG
ncbi:SpoIIE family protein phosphatase [Nonomuraea sp. K274]|uniref:protein-serine/threonine phosphatase n=2 Tax=Nonomuraea cypriaca TaxID=1187855 RepID=A0A931A3T2_9ACTN|nr:SpoIIE family protein phosphatase [Nonomuraea cypriaca]